MKQKTHIALLRVLATIAVITMHVGSGGSYSSDSMIRSAVTAVNTWCVPAFIMITGALFLNSGKKLDIRTHGKRVLRLLVILLLWATFYNLVSLIIINGTIRVSVILESLRMTITADTTFCYHFWYLYMVIGLYLLLPVLNAFLERASKRETLAFLILCLCFSIIVPMVQSLTDTTGYIWKSGFVYFGGFIVYLVLGYWIEHHTIKPWAFWVLLTTTLGWFIFTIVLSIQGSPLLEKIAGYQTIMAAQTATLLFVLCRKLVPSLNDRMKNAIAFASKHCFSIYIIHVIVIQLLRKALGFDSTFAPLYISIPVLTATVFAISLLIGWCLKKIPGIRRIV